MNILKRLWDRLEDFDWFYENVGSRFDVFFTAHTCENCRVKNYSVKRECHSGCTGTCCPKCMTEFERAADRRAEKCL